MNGEVWLAMRGRRRSRGLRISGPNRSVTTNPPFDHWTEVLGSERLTGATLDRLTHRCQIIETKGESYRLKDAKARVRTPQASDAHDPAKTTVSETPGALEGGDRTR